MRAIGQSTFKGGLWMVKIEEAGPLPGVNNFWRGNWDSGTSGYVPRPGRNHWCPVEGVSRLATGTSTAGTRILDAPVCWRFLEQRTGANLFGHHVFLRLSSIQSSSPTSSMSRRQTKSSELNAGYQKRSNTLFHILCILIDINSSVGTRAKSLLTHVVFRHFPIFSPQGHTA